MYGIVTLVIHDGNRGIADHNRGYYNVPMMNDTANLLQRIGYRVRIARELAGISQGELAQAAGVSRSFVTRIENGTAEPSISTLVQLGAALGVSMGQLIGEHPIRARPEQAAIRLLEEAVENARGVPVPIRGKLKRGGIHWAAPGSRFGVLHIPLEWMAGGNVDAIFVLAVRDISLAADGYPAGTHLLVLDGSGIQIGDTDLLLVQDRGRCSIRTGQVITQLRDPADPLELIGIMMASWRLHR